MTMNLPQSYCSLEPSGIRTKAVRLCVALLGVWVVVSALFLQSPVMSFSTPAMDVSSMVDVGSQLPVASVEEQDQESSACCSEPGCNDFQDCSSPCASNCPAPQVAVLESPLYRDSLNGADIVLTGDNDRIAPPLATLLFRPPIV